MKKMNYKGLLAKVINFSLKWINVIIASIAFAYIFFVILSNPKDQLISGFYAIEFSFTTVLLLITTVFLAFLNWLLESEKWRVLVNYLQPFSIFKAYKSILLGLTLAMITPKRLGELFGRALILDDGNRVKGLLLNSIASIAQLSVTLVFGILSFLFAITFYNNDAVITGNNKVIIIAISLFVLSSIFLFALFSKKIIKTFSIRIKSAKWEKYFDAFSLIDKKTIFKIQLLSVKRYLIFIVQFFVLLKIWGIDIKPESVFVLNSIIFLIMTVVPISALSESGVKSSISLLVFAAFPALSGNYSEASLLFASLSIWLINLVIPALIGVIISFYDGFNLRNSVKKAISNQLIKN